MAGQAGGGGATIGTTLSVAPSSATFPSTLVEAVSAPQTFTVRNDGSAPAGTTTAVAAVFQGANGADFSITSNGCATTLQPGASCAIAIAFAPKTRSGSRSASLTVNAPNSAPANVSLSGTALPSLGVLAGSLGGPGSTDGTGAAARFNTPFRIASDGAGNLYVADWTNHVIRKVVIATGAVTTLAGAPGQSGAVDGTGAAARFALPAGVASDGAGNLFVADNDAIRKIVVATGAVTTLAGRLGQAGSANGRGAAAQFNQPYDVASDGAGNLFVADTSNATVRKVVIATGAVTTLAGTASQTGHLDGTGAAARFTQPYGIASDGAGNLYVTDQSIVRKIVIATRVVSTLVGTPGPPVADGVFQSPEGITSDGAGNLYVADSSNDNVRKVVIATAAVTTVAGGFSQPTGVASDGMGNLYVADAGNNTIRKIVIATAAVTTLAGAPGPIPSGGFGTTWANSFNYPYGIASDGVGSLYVADTENSLIRKVDITTGAVTTFAGGSGASRGSDGTGTAASFDQPQGISYDGAGNLFVADTYDNTIRKIVIATGAVTTLAGTPGQTGSADGTGSSARFAWPSGVVSDGVGNLYVTDEGNRVIRKIVIATGAVTTLAGTPGQIGFGDGTGAEAIFAEPTGIATDGAGNLYVADTSNAAIRKIVIATGAVTTFAGTAGQHGTADGTGTSAQFSAPWGIVSDGMGNLYVADASSSTIRKIVIATAAVTTVAGKPDHTGTADGTGADARFNGAYGITVDGVGDLFVADTINNSIRRVEMPSGTVSTVAGAPDLTGSVDATGVAARFTRPTGIAGDGAGNLYVTDSNDTIRKIVVATRAVTTFAGAPGQQGDVEGIGMDARFTRPSAIFGDGGGNLYVTDGLVVRGVTVAAGAVTTVAGTQNVWGVNNLFAGPMGVVSDGAGNLYVAENALDECDCVRKVVIATGAVSILVGGPYDTSVDGTGADAHFSGPRGIATDGAGNLYVTDSTAIRQVNIATGVVTTLAGVAYYGGSADGVGAAARFIAPSGIAGDGAGNLYVADGNTIRKVVIASATVSTVIGSFGQAGVSPGALPATLNAPVALTVLPTGELAIVDSVENAVLIGHL